MFLTLEKPKLSYIGSITIKANRELSGKETKHHNHHCLNGHLEIDDWNFSLFEPCKTHEQLKERKNLLTTPT